MINELKNYTEKEYSHLIAPVVNSYYILAESSDMMLRLMEQLLNIAGHQVKGQIKHRHRLMMENIKILKLNNEKFLEDYAAFNGDWSKYDELRRTANYIARLLLLISDRAFDNEGKELLIESMIKNLKSTGRVDERFINYFNMK